MVTLRAATRSSPLALWQARHVGDLLEAADPDTRVVLVEVDTDGDRRTEVPIAELGGKGVFAKEVQQAVLDGDADIAVHSAKDLPSITLPGLALGAVPTRGDARDALVGSTLAALPQGASVATGSNRRRVQLAAQRPDLVFHELRGNMATRLEKAAGFDAIVVAAVAFQRLGWGDKLSEVLSPELVVPQVGQGALAVECRDDDAAVRELLAPIQHVLSRWRVDAERAFLAELGGDCDLPAGAHAVVAPSGKELQLQAVLAGGPDQPVVRWSGSGTDADALGRSAAQALREGAA